MAAPSQTEGGRETPLSPQMAAFYERSRAAEFGITAEQFAALLREVAARHAPAMACEDFCGNLRLEDLALARACAAGHERAWEIFMQRFREKLYTVAGQITREDSLGRELADSVYADLYGTRTRDGQRVSKLKSYSGRGSLEGWLRTVLAQEYINNYRRQRRMVSLDEEEEEGTQYAAANPEPVAPADPRLERAVAAAIRSLADGDRFVLASYFLDQRTLAEIAVALRVHESTISRKVERLTKALRKQVMKNLISQGMSRRQAEEALEIDVRDLTLDLRSSLAQESPAGAFSKRGAESREAGR